MKKIFVMLALISTLGFSQIHTLNCKSGEAELLSISKLKNEQNISFNETQNKDFYIKLMSSRIDAVSPVLGQMFANVYTEVSSLDNLSLGAFQFPSAAVTKSYRICSDKNEVPESKILGVYEGHKLNVDSHLYDQLSDFDRESLMVRLVVKKLIQQKNRYSSPLISKSDADVLSGLLLSEGKSEDRDKILETLNQKLVIIPLEQAAKSLQIRFSKAKSYEAALEVLENQNVKLVHGTSYKLSIKKRDLKPYELEVLEAKGTPLSSEAVFWAIPAGFGFSGLANAGLSLGAWIVTNGGGLSVAASTAVWTVGIGIGVGITTYGLIANTLYKRKLKFLKSANDLYENQDAKTSRLFNRFYKRFSKKFPGISKLEYATRVIDLAYENKFVRKGNKFITLRKMSKVVNKSFN